MPRGKCDVPGCPETKLRSPRLCNTHTILWFQSGEESETRRKPFDCIQPYQRWLKRVSGEKSIATRSA